MEIFNFIYKEKKYLIFFVILLFIIFFYLYWAFVSDITIDEISYIYMYRDSQQPLLSYLADYILHADHFPLCFSIKLFFFQLFDNIIPLRIFSIICAIFIYFLIFKILKFKKFNLRDSLIFIILFVSSPLMFYHTVYFSYYYLAFLFLTLSFYYYLVKGKQLISFVFLIFAIASHYFSIFFLAIFIIKKFKLKKDFIVYLFLVFIVIFSFYKFDKNFNSLNSGEGNFISIQDNINPELNPDFSMVVKSIGNSLIFPGMYSPFTLKYFKNYIVSFICLLCMLFLIYKNKNDIFVYTIPAFLLCFLIVSYYVKITYGLLIFAPVRIFFVSVFAIISICYTFIKLRKFKIISLFIFVMILLLYLEGFLYIYQKGFEIQQTAEFIKNHKIIFTSFAKEFDGKFDFKNMIEYYLKDNYVNKKGEQYFLVLKHGDFNISKKGKEYKLVYNSNLFQIYSLFPKSSLLK
ncbi:MAG: hypothetical protein M0R46_17155 [Candidatus Muirbacterium halophilum]|nr:hypothetical protein [Candidatus Muirbacterium halophilum]MCK9477647.1 hypothetical protein [Candidatus Muirbacterium halophilum]